MQNSLRTAGDGGPYGRLGVGTDILGGPFGLGAWRTGGPSGRPVPTKGIKKLTSKPSEAGLK